MGEAKRRGTFEQRKAEAVVRNEQEEREREERVARKKREREERERERRAALTDKEREAEDAKRQKTAVVTGAALGLASIYSKQIRDWSGKGIF